MNSKADCLPTDQMFRDVFFSPIHWRCKIVGKSVINERIVHLRNRIYVYIHTHTYLKLNGVGKMNKFLFFFAVGVCLMFEHVLV